MLFDDRFDFFRVNLQAPDIDDAVTPTGQVISISAQLDHVAGIDESLAARTLHA
jgi:hypothetical protein